MLSVPQKEEQHPELAPQDLASVAFVILFYSVFRFLNKLTHRNPIKACCMHDITHVNDTDFSFK